MDFAVFQYFLNLLYFGAQQLCLVVIHPRSGVPGPTAPCRAWLSAAHLALLDAPEHILDVLVAHAAQGVGQPIEEPSDALEQTSDRAVKLLAATVFAVGVGDAFLDVRHTVEFQPSPLAHVREDVPFLLSEHAHLLERVDRLVSDSGLGVVIAQRHRDQVFQRLV